jgi:hypothetical protein
LSLIGMFMSTDKSIAKKRKKSKTKFKHFFPKGFYDETYIDWERNYKWFAHQSWVKQLNRNEYSSLLDSKKYIEIVQRAVNIESKTNLLFSFEKMALRDAVKDHGAKLFAEGLFEYIYGNGSLENRFKSFINVLSSLPRKQTRVVTWPLITVFGFIANPTKFIFLKPRVTMKAAEVFNFDFKYSSKPDWNVYKSYLDFANEVKSDIADMKPRDFIDIQSYIWVMGSDEYED